MARQVVSYDDLAPASEQSQAASLNSATTSSEITSQQPAANGTHSISPATKKRRRDEDMNGDNASRNTREGFSNVHAADGRAVPTNIASLQQSLPPKPQVKKRGKNKRRFGGGAGTGMAAAPPEAPYNQSTASLAVQHWDDPGTQADGISYDENGAEVNGAGDDLDEGNWNNGEEGEGDMDLEDTEDIDEEEDEADESRELTHEEIWDDSALVAAWDAANEEYEAIHGKTKRWKQERVHRSPLWYNIPPEKPSSTLNRKKGKGKRNVEGISSAAGVSPEAVDVEVDSSVPQDFETYVPTHDPSLMFPVPPSPPMVPEPTRAQLQNIASQYSSMLPSSSSTYHQGTEHASPPSNLTFSGTAAVSADEAFSRALGAMYWCGYWTAVYHTQRGDEQNTLLAAKNFGAEVLTEAQEEEETVELLSTQR